MIQLELPNYLIYVGSFQTHLKALLNERAYTRTYVLVDENTKKACLSLVLSELAPLTPLVIEISSGELNKNLETCIHIWQELMADDADRKSLLINLGGGVIGDMGGFCASTFKRGMDFIQMPTTLLSQVDASIGGKLGIDFAQVKNSIGLFKDPQAVFVDPAFLQTLPPRELRSGLAEIIKHSLIADASQWHDLLLIEDLNSISWPEYLVPSLKVKQRIVAEDPFEHGIRKALNFGHTIGHAVESEALESDKPLLHGEAVAIGMVCESYLSHQAGLLEKEALDSISQYILKHYGHPKVDTSAREALLGLMRKDKKNENSVINFTFLKGIGHAQINQTCSDDLIMDSLEYYNGLVF